jgi:hypothetical protein
MTDEKRDLALLEAECGAMRIALEAADELFSMMLVDSNALLDEVEKRKKFIYAALSSAAGKTMAEHMKRLKAVAEAAKRKRNLELERMEVIRKLANHEITKQFWLEDTVRYENELEKVEAELDKALAALKEENQ